MNYKLIGDIIVCHLDGSRERFTQNAIDEQQGESIKIVMSWFDYIGTQDGDRIYQERKPND